MKTSRSTRFLTALVAMLSMLYMQLAVAAYVCPGMPAGSGHGAASAHAAMIDMPNCQGMDAAQPALCHLYAHDVPFKQSLDTSAMPDVPPFLPAALILNLQFSDAGWLPGALPPRPIALTRATAPPLPIRHCRFHI